MVLVVAAVLAVQLFVTGSVQWPTTLALLAAIVAYLVTLGD